MSWKEKRNDIPKRKVRREVSMVDVVFMKIFCIKSGIYKMSVE